VTLPRRTARRMDLWKRWSCNDVSKLFEVWIEMQMGDFEVRSGRGG
jgi:hypothetical protein